MVNVLNDKDKLRVLSKEVQIYDIETKQIE